MKTYALLDWLDPFKMHRNSCADHVDAGALSGGSRSVTDRIAAAVSAWSRFDARPGRAVLIVVVAVHACTLGSLALSEYLGIVNFALLYLTASAWCALTLGRGAAVLASTLSVLEFNFFFVPPVYSLAVHDWRYLISFALMILLTLLIAELRARLIGQAEATERGRAEIERQQAQRTLLGSLSHDLRTPMTAILGSAVALRDEATLDGATRHDLVDGIAVSAARMSRLLNHILEMARFDAGAVQLKKGWIDLDDLAQAALQSVAVVAEGIDLQVDCDADMPPVECDPTLLLQVLVNLLENACRHTPPGGAVAVAIGIEGESARVDVRDDGSGIEPIVAQHLFERFQHAPERSGAGIGLGLAICRTIVTLHGGTIQGRNRPSRGAEFTFWLPLAAAPRECSE